MSYTSNEELDQLIKDAKETGVLSERLCVVVTEMVHGIVKRFNFLVDPDDLAQDVFLHLPRKLCYFKPAPEGNAFAYLTKIVRNHYGSMLRPIRRDRKFLVELTKKLMRRY